mmetsp:Transcript_24662/g.81284  ORF Transcript_24662/g.81284 Transcript_24662/m.81284 type:complete len:229 (-) Transcript_24662:499-1185(-)
MLVGAPLQGATSILPPRLCRPLCSSSSIESGGQSEEEERFKRPQDSSLQSILRSVPLARRGVEYVAPLASRGEFGRSVAHSPLLLPPPSRVLELSAGSTAAWSSRVHAADSSDGSMLVVAADLTPPADAAEGVTCLAADNARLADCARLQHLAPFDVVFGGHMLCTCRWPSRPFAFCRAAAATTAAAAASPPPLGEERPCSLPPPHCSLPPPHCSLPPPSGPPALAEE